MSFIVVIHTRTLRRAAAVAVFAMTAAAAAGGENKVTLSGSEETPPVTTTATGAGVITVKDDKTVSGSVKVKGIAVTAAHIHAGAPGQSGPPVVTLAKTSDDTWSVPADSTLTDEQYASYKAGNLYINVHTAENKKGELRGQLKP